MHLKKFVEARVIADEALAKKMDSGDLRVALYQIAFLRNDAAGMAQQVSWSLGKPGKENAMLYLEANSAAHFGKLRAAREISRQATISTAQAGEKETAAGCAAAAALWEALYGNAAPARQHAAAALALSKGRDTQFIAALALAYVRDSARALALVEELEKRYPEDIVVRFNYAP